MSIYSPWFRKWIAAIHANETYLARSPVPNANSPPIREEFKSIFSEQIPRAPPSHSLSDVDQKHFGALWPAGEHAARERLEKFCSEMIQGYALHRSEPGSEATSCLSVHLSQGTISARTCIRLARATNTSNKFDKGNAGNISWISEVAWRDFYRRIVHDVFRNLIPRCSGGLASCM